MSLLLVHAERSVMEGKFRMSLNSSAAQCLGCVTPKPYGSLSGLWKNMVSADLHEQKARRGFLKINNYIVSAWQS